jgi:hypothetical protein
VLVLLGVAVGHSYSGAINKKRAGWFVKNQATNFRVTKKLSPVQPGAIKLARRYGEQLVCVRHRVDPTGTTRITTVELVVDQAPIAIKPEQIVGVRIEYREGLLQSAVKAAGATWDKKAGVWRMPMKIARRLHLRDRIIEK